MSERGKPDKPTKHKDKGRREKRRPESAMYGDYDNAMKQGVRVRVKARKRNER